MLVARPRVGAAIHAIIGGGRVAEQKVEVGRKVGQVDRERPRGGNVKGIDYVGGDLRELDTAVVIVIVGKAGGIPAPGVVE